VYCGIFISCLGTRNFLGAAMLVELRCWEEDTFAIIGWLIAENGSWATNQGGEVWGMTLSKEHFVNLIILFLFNITASQTVSKAPAEGNAKRCAQLLSVSKK